MPSGDDEEIVARCAPLLGFGEALPGGRLLVGLFASARFLGEVLTAAFLIAAFLAGRNVLE
ncbi:hypothetical protein ACNJX9_29165 [Bradyrhizobium sp. DASA03076]|uniref:Uncharacterized protein n=1 Tax=Bradyrhizobium manausense TaxID=989370 RepID=A0A0R3D6I5_9BRAD|nr:hypothetical protein [Bradyrhizobium manausense]KRQ05536.1 hypothetical protein AOQ71_28340 [Bradyrhizobium manausense]